MDEVKKKIGWGSASLLFYFTESTEVYFGGNKIGVDTGAAGGLYLSTLNLNMMTTDKAPAL